jgi:hypothetical protein
MFLQYINCIILEFTPKSELFIVAGPAIPSVVVYPKRSQTSTADSDLKEDGIPSRKPSGSAVGGKGIAPASPMLGNASNPNKADIPERKKSPAVPSVSVTDLWSNPRVVGLEPTRNGCHLFFQESIHFTSLFSVCIPFPLDHHAHSQPIQLLLATLYFLLTSLSGVFPAAVISQF